MHPDWVATPHETVLDLLTTASRIDGDVPIRVSFVQQGSRGAPQPGPLATLIHRGDRRGLDLFLLLKAVASAPPHNSHRSAAVWARALRHTGVTANEQTISRIWRRLDDLGLVARSKSGRQADILLMDESGSHEVYIHPAHRGDRYFRLPVAYWLDTDNHWSATLGLPAKAMLLVALSRSDRDSFCRSRKSRTGTGCLQTPPSAGSQNLCRRKVLGRARVPKKAPLAPQGLTYDTHYTLRRDFSTSGNVGNDD